mmetsp:Transcript_64636/g.162665  ORF Transcript_64636/g.162665 Transcript_64636/m.162665 type:complete len:222 (-) Transcript_64636:283-948(-)
MEPADSAGGLSTTTTGAAAGPAGGVVRPGGGPKSRESSLPGLLWPRVGCFSFGGELSSFSLLPLMVSTLFFFLALISPSGQRWQCLHSAPFWQPPGLYSQAQGLHSPVPWSCDPGVLMLMPLAATGASFLSSSSSGCGVFSAEASADSASSAMAGGNVAFSLLFAARCAAMPKPPPPPAVPPLDLSLSGELPAVRPPGEELCHGEPVGESVPIQSLEEVSK